MFGSDPRLKTLAIVLLVLGLPTAFVLAAMDGPNRFAGIGLAFFCGGLAVWRVLADDLQHAFTERSRLAERNRDLTARCEELEDKTWELGESDERQASILATLGDIVIRRDADGVVTYVNSAAQEILGRRHAPEVGLPIELPEISRVGPESDAHAQIPAGAEAMGFGDLRLETLSGPRWFSRLDVAVRDPATDQQLVQTVLRDVTERRLIEEDLLAARQTAETSNEAKSRFLATVSHEIRTPLNGILGMAALLRDTRLTKEQGAYLDALATSGETLLLLIDEVLDFSKVEAGKLDIHAAPVRIGPIVESVVELMAPKAHAKELEIGAHVDPCVPDIVTVDPTRIRQILLNLTGNGVKFTDKGGVAVKLNGRANPDGGSFLDISVRDTGIGFGKDEAERLFQEFEQVDHGPARKFGGTGLGLAIARRLANLMGGDITAEPGPKGGAHFHVRIPVPEDLRMTPMGEPSPFAGRRVVMVSDSSIECDLLAATFRSMGAEASLFRPGDPDLDDALTATDLLLVDHGALSDSAGWLATARLAGCQALPVVMISPPQRDRLEDLRAAGYAAYLIRPVRHETLVQVLGRLLDAPHSTEAWDASFEPVARILKPNQPQVPARPLKLLVAEDNDINRLLGEAMLRKLGHVPTMVVDGESAVKEARTGAYDAILMDLHMPGLDGLGAIRAIRRDEAAAGRPEVPVLVVTADVMQDAQNKARDVGASAYLTKPLSVDAIAEALSAVAQR